MPKFGLTRPLGYGPFQLPPRPYSYGPFNKYSSYKRNSAARKIQKLFRGSSTRRKFPVKLFAKMRRTGRFPAPNFRLSQMYK